MQVLNDDSHKILSVTQMISKNCEQTYTTRFWRLLNMTPGNEKLASVYSIQDPWLLCQIILTKSIGFQKDSTPQATMRHFKSLGVQLQIRQSCESSRAPSQGKQKDLRGSPPSYKDRVIWEVRTRYWGHTGKGAINFGLGNQTRLHKGRFPTQKDE